MLFFKEDLKNLHVIPLLHLDIQSRLKQKHKVGEDCLAHTQPSTLVSFLTPKDKPSVTVTTWHCQIPPPTPPPFCLLSPASLSSFTIFSYSQESSCQNSSGHLLTFSVGASCLLGTNICDRRKEEAGLSSGDVRPHSARLEKSSEVSTAPRS